MLLILEWLVKVELQIVVSNAWSKWTNSKTQEAPTLRLRFFLVNSRKNAQAIIIDLHPL